MRNSFEEVRIYRHHTLAGLPPISFPMEYTYKDHCADALPQQVVEIQKRKKLLAKVTFSQDPLSEAGIGLGTLQVCLTALSYVRAIH
jgi:hypothetical protein